MSPEASAPDVYRAEAIVARSQFTEASLTPEERLDLVVDILLRGVERLLADRAREKTQRWRERKDAAAEASCLYEPRGQRPHVDEEVACEEET